LRTFIERAVIPKKFDHRSVSEFCKKFEDELSAFNKKTLKNYYIIKNLIGAEIEAIVRNLKKLDILVSNIQKKIPNLELLEKLLEKLDEVYAYIGEKEERTKNLQELEKKRSELISMETKLRKDIEALKNSAMFAELTRLQSRKEELERQREKLKDDILIRFASLTRVLKKMHKIKPNSLIEDYINNPFDALMHDSGLHIIPVLSSLREMIEEGKIEERDKEKVLKEIEYIDRKFLYETKEKAKDNLKEIKSMEAKIKENRFDAELNALLEQLDKVERETAEIDEKIEKARSRRIKEDIEFIEESVKKLGFKVVIKNAPYD